MRHIDGSLCGAEADAAADHIRACARCASVVELLAPEPPMPNRIGRFAVRRKLGAGAMGVVYEAHDPELRRDVAVKVVSPVVSATLTVGRVRREARAMAKIAHPNVVPIYDVGEVDSGLFIAMALIDGPTMTEWLGARQRSWSAIVSVMCRAGLGIAAAHDVGVIHRDFKPDNVLVAAGDCPLVADFGLAARGGELGSPTNETSAPQDLALGDTATRTDVVLGTPRYMSPEQFGGHADRRSDQFSFCVALYEALYGASPFRGRSLHSLMAEVTAGSVRQPSRGQGVPRWLWRVIRRGLSADPADRWRDMRALIGALQPARRRRWAAGLLGVAVAPLVASAMPEKEAPWHDTTPATLDAVWSTIARDTLRAKFAATAHPEALGAFEQVEATLDAYAASWAGERAHADLALVDRAPRLSCLRERRQSLITLLAVLSTVREDTVARAPGVAASLRAPSDCRDDPQAPSAELDPEVEDRIRPVQAGLDRVSMTYQLGDLDKAGEIARETHTLARSVGCDPMIIEALVVRGRIEFRTGRYDEAQRTYEELYFMAVEEHVAERALHAAGVLVLLHGQVREDLELANKWVRHGHAVLDRNPSPRSTGLVREAQELMLKEGSLALAAGDVGRGVELLTDAANEIEATGGEPRQIAGSRSALADALLLAGRKAEAIDALRRVVSLQRGYLDPSHPAQLRALSVLARRLAESGGPDASVEAKTFLTEALVHVDEALPSDPLAAISVLSNLSMASRSVGHYEDALRLRQRALDIDLESTRRYLVKSYSLLGLINADLARWPAARDAYELALARLKDGQPDPKKKAWVRCRLAQAQAALGKHDTAKRNVASCAANNPKQAAIAAEVARREHDGLTARAPRRAAIGGNDD
ncbi:MAG: serine/threonine-protein kinase [Myxococcota bacterium]